MTDKENFLGFVEKSVLEGLPVHEAVTEWGYENYSKELQEIENSVEDCGQCGGTFKKEKLSTPDKYCLRYCTECLEDLNEELKEERLIEQRKEKYNEEEHF